MRFATGEFAARILTPALATALTFVLIGGFTRRWEKKAKRKQSVLNELTTCLTGIQKLSAEVAREVELHLLGITEVSLKESQQRIGVQLKMVAREVDTAKLFLGDADWQALQNALLQWNDGLTGDGYPVQQKAKAFKPHDAIIKRVQDAQAAWNGCLADLKVRCLQETCVLKVKC